MSEVYVLAVRSDGSVAHVAFQTTMRYPTQPSSGGWVADGQGSWRRDPTDANILHDLKRLEEYWRQTDGLTISSWRRLTQQEHEMFERDRNYRDALELTNSELKHNMPKARELHRALLRHVAGDKLMTLDRQWVDASASGDVLVAREIQRQRKALRDASDDPRIEAAQMLDELKRVVIE